MDSGIRSKWFSVRKHPHDPAWDKYEVFEEWCKNAGYQEGLSLYRKDASKPFGPSNCHWNGAGAKHIQKDKRAKEFIHRWNRTVNRFRKAVGMNRFGRNDTYGILEV